MSSRLCTECNATFIWTQIVDEERPYHQSKEHVQEAADQGCYICGIIVRSDGWRSVESFRSFKCSWYLSSLREYSTDWMKLVIEVREEEDNDSSSTFQDEAEDLDSNSLQRANHESAPSEGGIDEENSPIWAFWLQPSADVEDNIRSWVPPPRFDSPGLFDLAHEWLSSCVTKHSTCRKQNLYFRPTRLLEILTDDAARIVLPHSELTNSSYAALSHCWGKTERLKLLLCNFAQLCSSIDIRGLPTSYQEAIRICRRLEIRYIWIDSLCIIQDSKEDWQRESLTMRDVYGNSIMTIAASAAAESSESSFAFRNVALLQPLLIQTEWDGQGQQNFCISDRDTYDSQITASPLQQRAWVLQESAIAQRTLHLTKSQLWWDCHQFAACEAYPRGLPDFLLTADQKSKFSGLPPTPDSIRRRWSKLVEDYSARHLTVLTDKMTAFAAIAQDFQELLPTDVYLAGLWRSHLPLLLSWNSRIGGPCHRPEEYRAPSWSWASVEGQVIMPSWLDEPDQGRVEELCSLLDAVTHASDGNDKSHLSGGFIQIKGKLTQVYLKEHCIALQEPDGSWQHINGSDEACGDPMRDEAFTRVFMDEYSIDGWGILSCSVDNLTPQVSSSDHIEGATRIYFDDWDGDFLALPVAKWHQKGTVYHDGIILCHSQAWPEHIYQRVGAFVVVGEHIFDEIRRRSSEKIVTIL